MLGLTLAGGFAWYERDKPPARVLALVATMAALAVVGRLAFAAVPNVKPTTDIVLFAGYALGGVPGFAVGALAALVSNVFLSEGPWTPWQMTGWGAVGVAGALLARVWRGRQPHRLALAAVCGLAGLAFGAWMDLYQLTLAAHQDLDSYLAVSASSLPYNLAHAIGNVVFCVLIGPVFIRALERYRRRFAVRWAAPAAAALLVMLAVPAGAAAATATDRAERWLVRAQNWDGGFGAAPGQGSSRLFSGWAGLGLAAAGRNPRDVHRPGGRSLARYVARSAGSLRDIGEIERTIMVLETAGLSARDFAGRDLVAAVRARRRGDGSIAGYVSYTAFGVLALRSAGVSAGRSTVRWLVGSQNGDGGFGLARASASDSDMTGAALQALATVGRRHGIAARRAVAWLRANQNDDGGFGQSEGRSSNAQSTAYAVQGLVAADAPGATIARALAYLRGLQRAHGSVAYSSTSAQTPVWVTAQALMALERRPLPFATVRRAKHPSGAGSATGTSSPVPAAKPPDHRKRGRPAATPPPGKAGGSKPEREAATRAHHDTERAGQAGPATHGVARTPASGERDGGERLSAGIVVAAVAGVLAVVVLFRRRLVPKRLRRPMA